MHAYTHTTPYSKKPKPLPKIKKKSKGRAPAFGKGTKYGQAKTKTTPRTDRSSPTPRTTPRSHSRGDALNRRRSRSRSPTRSRGRTDSYRRSDDGSSMRWGRESYQRDRYNDKTDESYRRKRRSDDHHSTTTRSRKEDDNRRERSYEEQEREDKAKEKRDLQRSTRKSMLYAKDHGFLGAPDLRKTERIKEMIGPAAPLGTCIHSANILRAIGSPNYLPSRIKADFLYKDDGEIWCLQYWIHKPPRVPDTVNLKQAGEGKLTWQDTQKDQCDTVFTSPNMLVNAAWRRSMGMLHTAIPGSQGFVKPALWGPLLDYTHFLTTETYVTELSKLVAFDTELMIRRSLGNWDFDKPVPTDVLAIIILKLPAKQSKCLFCEGKNHDIGTCRLKQGKKDLPQTMQWDNYCRPWNMAASGSNACSGNCMAIHRCMACDSIQHPISGCHLTKTWTRKAAAPASA